MLSFGCFYYIFLFYVFCFSWFQVVVPFAGHLLASSMLRWTVVLLLLRPLWAAVSTVTSSLAYQYRSSYLWYYLWSMPFPCKVSPCGFAGLVCYFLHVAAVLQVGVFCVPRWSTPTLDWVDLVMGPLTLARLVSLTDCSLDSYSSSMSYPGVFVARVSTLVFVILLPVPLMWQSLLRANVVNRAKSDIQVVFSGDM